METTSSLNIRYSSFSHLFLFTNCVVCWVRESKISKTCSPIPELSAPQYWVSHHPNIVLVSKQPMDVNSFSLVIVELTSCHWPQDGSTQWRTPPTLAPQQAGGLTGRVTQGYLFLSEAQEYFSNSSWSWRGRHSFTGPPLGRDVLLLWLPASV